ncbi:MAG: hypothetical protein JSS61_02010 [Verrucomicrobia bacterium]|nr:hypothetical protein [Verrucomicrobiota bacterium]
MLKEEFDRLAQLFKDGAEGKPVRLESVFQEALAFFEQLKRQLSEGDDEQKIEALTMMREMHQLMEVETKKIVARSGVTQEDLVAYADNPTNFTPEQWRAMQESKDKILHVGSDLTKIVVEMEGPARKDEKAAKKANKSTTRKGKWLRS